MEVVKQTVTIPADRELLIKLPENAAPNQTAEATTNRLHLPPTG